MRAFVTGGTGFLGSHIVDACQKRGDEVKALHRPTSDVGYLRTLDGVELVRGDLCDESALTKALRGVDVVYHSAARVLDYGSRRQFVETNVVGTQRLLTAARRARVPRFVFVSSPSIVMNGAHQVDIDESTPYSPRFFNLYSETKAAAEELVLAANDDSFVTCSLRPRGIWGPRDLRGAMPKMVKLMKRGKLRRVRSVPRVRSVQDDSPTIASICYCENAAHACMLAAQSDRVGGRAYFISDAEPIEVWPFCDELADRFGVPRITRTISPRFLSVAAAVFELLWRIPLLGRRYSPPVSRYLVSLLTHSATYDISAARRDLGYKPIVSHEEGFERLHAWLSDGGTERFIQHV